MSTADPSPAELVAQILASNEAYAAGAELAPDAAPSRHTAIVTCMDARIPVLDALGFAVGEAHVLRNAGGVVTDDTVRSLILSQRRLGTRAVVLVHHTRCGVEGLDENGLLDELEADAGARPTFSFGGFAHPADSVRESAARLRRSGFLPHTDAIIGFVYDVDTGRLDPVDVS